MFPVLGLLLEYLDCSNVWSSQERQLNKEEEGLLIVDGAGRDVDKVMERASSR